MTAERYGSKTDVVVKLVLVFFIALLSFSIGTFVGKKFSDNQHKLAEMEPVHDGTEVANSEESADAKEERGIASVHPDVADVKPEKALSDEEITKLAEEFVSDEQKTDIPGKVNDKAEGEHVAKNDHGDSHADKHDAHGTVAAKEDAHAAPAEKHEAKHEAKHETKAPAAVHEEKHEAKKVEPSKPAARMAEGHSAVIENPAKSPSRIPSSLPKEIASSAIGKYTVQVAAYTTEKEAQTMSANLKEKGFSAFYVAAVVKGTTYFRVSVGLFSTKSEADAYKKDLLARAKVSSALVQKVTSAE